MSINWSNPKASISKNFTVHEALYLPKWQCYHIPSEQEKENILKQVEKLELIRDVIGPIIVHVWIRPTSVNCPTSEYHGKDYNKECGGAQHSGHIDGSATDYHALNMSCDNVKALLIPKLVALGIRMEKNGLGANWIHTDIKPPNPNNYFIP